MHVPEYVIAGINLLDMLYAEKFEGRAERHRTTNAGGQPVNNPVFSLHAYCWCEGETQHPDGCPPNFRHHATGFEVTWYKHSSRGSDASKHLTAAEWASILTECITEVMGAPAPYRILITGSREYGADLFQKKALLPAWKTIPSPQRDAMVEAFRGARARAGGRPILVVQGCAAGADSLAAAIASLSGCEVEDWPALWRREDGSTRGGYDREEVLRVRPLYMPGAGYNPKAGPERNNAMVASGADECLAFKARGAKNRGTTHCINAATAAGIPVTVTTA